MNKTTFFNTFAKNIYPMTKILNLLLALLCATSVSAQVQDTTIYNFTDVPPFAKLCANATLEQRAQCSKEVLMKIIAQNVIYPPIARENNITGKVFAQFVVEKDGKISNVKIVKGIPVLNQSVLDVFEKLKKEDFFEPASLNGVKVRYSMVVPVSFKIEEPEPVKPYILLEKDTVYTSPTKAAKFMGGADGLTKYIKEKTPKLKQLDDSCSVGIIQYSIVIRPNHTVNIIDTYDFSNLGFDAQFEGLSLILGAATKWEAGEYNGIKVNTTENIRIKFQPNAKKCPNAVKNFDTAAKFSDEALKQIDLGEANNEKALELLNKAIALDRKNSEIRYQRGMLEVNMKKNNEACEDLSFVKKNLKVNWADFVLKVVCRK